MRTHSFLARLGVEIPIIQAPMAGISTPPLAAAVSNAGGLGSIALGASTAAAARAQLAELRRLTPRAIHANVFAHAPAHVRPETERAWLDALRPEFARYGASPPAALSTIYRSFAEDGDMLDVLAAAAPEVVSLHFGLAPAPAIARLRAAGSRLLVSVTSVDEARAAVAASADALVAQGWEAGGHRGVFDPRAADERLPALALLARLKQAGVAAPVIVAGGIMDGADVRRALERGAAAVQCGTAFVPCPESAADGFYRQAISLAVAAERAGAAPSAGAARVEATVMTRAISGRPARTLANRFTAWEAAAGRWLEPPDYPRAYDAGKALNTAAKAAGEGGYGAQWAGEGVGRCRVVPAGELVRRMWEEAGGAAP